MQNLSLTSKDLKYGTVLYYLEIYKVLIYKSDTSRYMGVVYVKNNKPVFYTHGNDEIALTLKCFNYIRNENNK